MTDRYIEKTTDDANTPECEMKMKLPQESIHTILEMSNKYEHPENKQESETPTPTQTLPPLTLCSPLNTPTPP